MADDGFPNEKVFTLLHENLLALARDVQEGQCDKANVKAWVTESCIQPIESGNLSFVTGDGMRNFAGETLGDWTLMLREFQEALERKLSSDEMATEAEIRANKKVTKAEGSGHGSSDY